jgi:hypothetical protein
MLLEPVKNPAPGETVKVLLFQRGEVNLELAEEEAGEQLLIDLLSSDDGIVEIIDKGPDSGGKVLFPWRWLHGRFTIEKKLKVADRCATIDMKRTSAHAFEKLQ